MVMPMPRFAITLLSPTSTSCHIEVAARFSGNRGIIIEFHNEEGMAAWVMGLDVSWISRFKEEDERYQHINLPITNTWYRYLFHCI